MTAWLIIGGAILFFLLVALVGRLRTIRHSIELEFKDNGQLPGKVIRPQKKLS